LAAEGAVPASAAADAIARYDIDPDKTAPALA
jgi:pyruvate dehydrogenase complex dehydrogenase (E1) component